MRIDFKKNAGLLAVLSAGCLWGMMGLFVRRYAAYGLGTMDIVMVRCLCTALVLGLISLCKDRRLPKVRLKDLWCFLGTGVGSILFFDFCYFKTITLTSLSVAAVFLYTAPAFVLILSRMLFKERLGGYRLAALFLSLLACVLVSGLLGEQVLLTPMGILLGLGSGFGYALYSIFGRYALQRGYDSFTITFYTFLFAAVFGLPLSNLTLVVTAAEQAPFLLAFSIVFAFVSTISPYMLYTFGLTCMENTTASILCSVEPVVASLIGILVYGEALRLDVAAGVVIMLVAIVLCNKQGKTT